MGAARRFSQRKAFFSGQVPVISAIDNKNKKTSRRTVFDLLSMVERSVSITNLTLITNGRCVCRIYYKIAVKNTENINANNGIRLQIAITKNLCFCLQIFAFMLI